jgi:hypothetical protein
LISLAPEPGEGADEARRLVSNGMLTLEHQPPPEEPAPAEILPEPAPQVEEVPAAREPEDADGGVMIIRSAALQRRYRPGPPD